MRVPSLRLATDIDRIEQTNALHSNAGQPLNHFLSML